MTEICGVMVIICKMLPTISPQLLQLYSPIKYSVMFLRSLLYPHAVAKPHSLGSFYTKDIPITILAIEITAYCSCIVITPHSYLPTYPFSTSC